MTLVKKSGWLVTLLSVLSLFIVACQPIAPLVIEVIPEEEVTLTSLGPGARLTDSELTLIGRGRPGTEVLVLVDDLLVDVAQVGLDGTWSSEISLTEPGEHQLRVKAVNANRVVVAETEPVSFSFAPAAEEVRPSLSLPGGGEGLTTGSLLLTGRGQPGSEVRILVDGQPVGETRIGDDGTWSLETSLTEPGEHQLWLQTLDTGGTVIAETEPVSASFGPSAATTTALDIIFPADGADILLGQLSLVGPGEPDSQVEILDNSVVLGTAVISSDGEWSFTLEPATGAHQFAVRPGGDQAVRGRVVNATVIGVGESYDCSLNPGLDRGDNYIVGTCDTLGSISQQLGLSFENLRAANPQVEDPDLIYPGQILTVPQ